ncbi:MAG TPA: O-acetylhomoserine aminocarboxypropyltransferase [Acidimicrobiia bacterium]|nr:O-acetylhomoserine aminocarboxypropyltransferase [Acidimicrobiia bacterium]
MVRPDTTGFDTLSIHAGARPDPTTGARTTPIHHSASFVFRDTDHAASLFNLEVPGHIYSRISNPTVAVFEQRIAALEGGVAAVATASGQAALHIAITTLMGQGGHIVSSSAVYGGTVNLLDNTLPRFGITTTFVDPRDHAAIAAAITDDTRLVIAETIGNPVMNVLDLPAVAAVAHSAGVPLLIDNTFASPYLCRPIEWGADLVYHSATKFIGGHGVVIGGVLVDGGTFDWEASGRFPTLTEPYAGYHGIDFVDEFGTGAFAARARGEGLRDFGACMSPDTAFHLIQGCETLPVRMERHVANATRIAEYLEGHEMVRWVAYPGLRSHPDHDLAKRLLPLGAGAILSFGIEGGRAAGARFIESVEVFSHLANVGDLRSLVIHPASTTHQQMSEDQLAAAGIGDDLVRVSVGLEDPADLIADLERALRTAGRA